MASKHKAVKHAKTGIRPIVTLSKIELKNLFSGYNHFPARGVRRHFLNLANQVAIYAITIRLSGIAPGSAQQAPSTTAILNVLAQKTTSFTTVAGNFLLSLSKGNFP